MFGAMSLRPSRRNLNAVPKVKLGELQPLPEPAEEMAIAVEVPRVSAYGERTQHSKEAEICTAMNLLSSLRLDGPVSGNTTPSLSRGASFDREFEFDSADDSELGGSWQFSGDTDSSGFGNSAASFMSWTDASEVESTKRVKKLLDEFESCIYGEESLDKLKKETATECSDWRTKFPYFRVTGVKISPSTFDPESLCEEIPETGEQLDDEMRRFRGGCDKILDQEDEVEEVIASHGSYQEESLQDVEGSQVEALESESESSRPNTAESAVVYYDQGHAQENLKKKMSDYIKEQLVAYVWTEVSKTLERHMKMYSERTFQQKPSRPVSTQRPASRRTTTCASPQFLPAVETARSFTPISELSSLIQVSSMSIHRPVKRTYTRPPLEPSYEYQKVSTILPTIRFPQPLSLNSANQVFAPMPTEMRGYHSAADRRTRSKSYWRFNSISSDQEKLLKSLEEKQTNALNTTTTRQVSAPSSPPKWSRHVTLPPIENLHPSMTDMNLSTTTKTKTIEVVSTSGTMLKQKNETLISGTRTGSFKGSQMSTVGVKHKVSPLPVQRETKEV